MLQRVWIVSIMILVAATSSAMPAGPSQKTGQAGGGKGQVMKKLDADKDGQISKSEFEAAKSKAAARGKGKGKAGKGRGKVFDRLDANGDGSLSPAEMKKLQELRKQRAGSRKS